MYLYYQLHLKYIILNLTIVVNFFVFLMIIFDRVKRDHVKALQKFI